MISDTRQRLRAATAADHARLDRLFGRFNLSEPQSYAAFLKVNLSVLPSLEHLIVGPKPWSLWKPRTPALIADLKEISAAPAWRLDERTIEAFSDDPAAVWGVLYVLEGSRLGARVLSGRVAPGLPKRFLGGQRDLASWPAFLEALSQAGALASDRGLTAAENAARLAFRAYERAALAGSASPSAVIALLEPARD